MKSERFLTFHRQQGNYQDQGPEKDIVKIDHVTSMFQPLKKNEATRILFVRRENKNNNFIQRFLLFWISLPPLSPALEWHVGD